MCVCIPMFGMIESLSLGTSSGIVLYEIASKGANIRANIAGATARENAKRRCLRL